MKTEKEIEKYLNDCKRKDAKSRGNAGNTLEMKSYYDGKIDAYQSILNFINSDEQTAPQNPPASDETNTFYC